MNGLRFLTSWHYLIASLLVFGIAPRAILRLLVNAWPKNDPVRRALMADLASRPYWQRPLFVAEQFENALFDGLGARWRERWRTQLFRWSAQEVAVTRGLPKVAPSWVISVGICSYFTAPAPFGLAMTSAACVFWLYSVLDSLAAKRRNRRHVMRGPVVLGVMFDIGVVLSAGYLGLLSHETGLAGPILLGVCAFTIAKAMSDALLRRLSLRLHRASQSNTREC